MTFRVELNRSGVRELLQSQEVQDMLRAEAESRCPDGCAVDVMVGQNRANARITTATEEAYYDNMDHNTLLKAIGGADID